MESFNKPYCWKDLKSSEPLAKEVVRLRWLTDDETLREWQNAIKKNSIVKLKIRKGENDTFMMVELVDSEYKDEELKNILLEELKPIFVEELKPVFYEDELLGNFKLDKGVKFFATNIIWAGEESQLYFDLADEENMKDSIKTAHELFENQKHWNDKIKAYAVSELVGLANDWIKEESDSEEITREIFIKSIELAAINVYPKGEFEIFFFDGGLLGRHCIIVRGNINGNFDLADILT